MNNTPSSRLSQPYYMKSLNSQQQPTPPPPAPPRRPSENSPIPTTLNLKHSAHVVTGPAINPSTSVPSAAGLLSREFVARRISEGETGRLKEELKCQACGKGYKHISSLAKHLWEHTPEWNVTSKLLISKHQQVQLLEAASILVGMNEEDSSSNGSDSATDFSTPNTDSASPSPPPTATTTASIHATLSGATTNASSPSIPMTSARPISKHYNNRRNSFTNSPRRPSISTHLRTSTPSNSLLASSASRSLMSNSPVITDSLFTQDHFSSSLSSSLTIKQDDYELLASPYQRTRRMSHLRHGPSVGPTLQHMNDENEEENVLETSPHDSPEESVFGDME